MARKSFSDELPAMILKSPIELITRLSKLSGHSKDDYAFIIEA